MCKLYIHVRACLLRGESPFCGRVEEAATCRPIAACAVREVENNSAGRCKNVHEMATAVEGPGQDAAYVIRFHRVRHRVGLEA